MTPGRISGSGFRYSDSYGGYSVPSGEYGHCSGGYGYSSSDGYSSGGYSSGGYSSGGYSSGGYSSGGYSSGGYSSGGYSSGGYSSGGYSSGGYSSGGYSSGDYSSGDYSSGNYGGADQGGAAFGSSWMGGVSVVQPGAAQPVLSPCPPAYDSRPLPPAPLFPIAGAVIPPTDIRPVMFPAPKTSVDRTIQIGGFSWMLPPDPGEKGPYPSMTFLVGAAISSSKNGMMKLSDIASWIRARYPSKPVTINRTISCILCRGKDFINVRTGENSRADMWKLDNPQRFGSYYEQNIFLKHRRAIGILWKHRKASSASKQRSTVGASLAPGASLSGQPAPPGNDGETGLAKELLVKIGGRTIVLPPYRAGQKRPHLRLLCGCAIALGPEQGLGSEEIFDWIINRYPVQEQEAKKTLKISVKVALCKNKDDFQRLSALASGTSKSRWLLKNPAGLAASYGGRTVSSTVDTAARSSSQLSSNPGSFKSGVP